MAVSLHETLHDENATTCETKENRGGPGRTRTCNQIVMSDRL